MKKQYFLFYYSLVITERGPKNIPGTVTLFAESDESALTLARLIWKKMFDDAGVERQRHNHFRALRDEQMNDLGTDKKEFDLA
jgi:hypothetical protein